MGDSAVHHFIGFLVEQVCESIWGPRRVHGCEVGFCQPSCSQIFTIFCALKQSLKMVNAQWLQGFNLGMGPQL